MTDRSKVKIPPLAHRPARSPGASGRGEARRGERDLERRVGYGVGALVGPAPRLQATPMASRVVVVGDRRPL